MVHSWRNGWNPQAAQPGFAITGTLALALLFGRSMVGPLFAQTAWTNVTFIGNEVRDPGKKSRTRACRRVRGCGRTLCFGEHCLSGGAAVSGNPARATKCSRSGDGGRFRSARRDVHGRRDHDLQFRLRRWADSCWSAGLLCDGA